MSRLDLSLMKLAGFTTSNKPQHSPIIEAPFARAFQEEFDPDILNLGKLARKLLEDDRKKACERDAVLTAIDEKNPPKVEDKTESGDLSKQKKIATPGAPKLDKKEPKYTKLSDFIPPELKRNEEEVPSIKQEDEVETEMEEAEEVVDASVSKMHVTEAQGSHKPGDVWQTSGKKWGAINPKDKHTTYHTTKEKAHAWLKRDDSGSDYSETPHGQIDNKTKNFTPHNEAEKVGMKRSGGKTEWGREKGKQRRASHKRVRKQGKQDVKKDTRKNITTGS